MPKSLVKPSDDKKVVLDAVRCGECQGAGFKPIKGKKPNGKVYVGGYEVCGACVGKRMIVGRVI